jgi:hypothetical protein
MSRTAVCPTTLTRVRHTLVQTPNKIGKDHPTKPAVEKDGRGDTKLVLNSKNNHWTPNSIGTVQKLKRRKKAKAKTKGKGGTLMIGEKDVKASGGMIDVSVKKSGRAVV